MWCAKCGKEIAGTPVTFRVGGVETHYHPGHAPATVAAAKTLAALLHDVDGMLRAERWRETKDALQALGRKIGILLTGTADPLMNIRTEWFSALDALAEIIWPRAVGALARAYEPQTAENLVGALRGDIQRIEAMSRDESHAHRHGDFLIIPTKGVVDTAGAVKALDEAAAHVRWKFSKLLYGKVYVRPELRPKGSYDPRPTGRSRT